MKRFLKILPFILVLLVSYAMQVQLDVTDRFKPFLEPFGRAQELDQMKPNRPVQPIGDNRFVWLSEQNLVITKIDPATQQTTKETRPLPQQDIFAMTNFRMLGDQIVWVGSGRTLKFAKWQGNAWSQPQSIAKEVRSIDLKAAGNTNILVAGAGPELKIWEVTANGPQEIGNLAYKKAVLVNAAVDRKGLVHLGVINETDTSTYQLSYLTIDPPSKRISEPVVQKEIALDIYSIIDENSFGIDNTHGYYMMTFSSTRTHDTHMRLFSFPLDKPSEGTYTRMKANAPEGWPADYTYGAYFEPGQQDSLRLIYAARWGKSARIKGFEVFISTFQNGKMNPGAERVSNSQHMAVNPTFAKSGDATTVLYTVFNNYDNYNIYYTSDDLQYAAATNRLKSDDYVFSAMQVPQYMGITAVLMFYGLAWPVVSFLYLGYMILRREDSLHQHADRHLIIAGVIYLVTQIALFLLYATLDNYYTYSPAWMHSNVVIILLFVAGGVWSYLWTKLFSKLIYERNATLEFGYFTGLNLWSVLLFLSYFMAR